jgi:hypothetical protein
VIAFTAPATAFPWTASPEPAEGARVRVALQRESVPTDLGLLAAPTPRTFKVPNLERAAELLNALSTLWSNPGVTLEQQEALVREVFTRVTIDGKMFTSIEPKPVYAPPLFASMAVNEGYGYRALEPTRSPDTHTALASGVRVVGIMPWIERLARVA